jgi:K+/H+ antiporter YhaU regulatory subunit KhtT
MLSLISLIVIISLSMLITKIASISLMHTGLSKQSARFQARSALTGVGFTTVEAENVTKHPVRRRVIMTLMLVGNAGIITVISSFMLTFINVEEEQLSIWIRLLILFISIFGLIMIAKSKWIDRVLSRIINRMLRKYTDLNVRDYAKLLHLSGEYSISEFYVEDDDWLVNQTLEKLELRKEGVNVLAITRTDGTYLGVPSGDTEIEPGDTLLLYGKVSQLKSLDDRRKGREGDTQHEKLVIEHKTEKKEEKKKDRIRKKKRKKEKKQITSDGAKDSGFKNVN